MSKAAGIENIYPLSPLQKGLLFHTLYTPGGTAYFEQLTCELHGRLDEEAFAATWQMLAARHAILRTAFVVKGQREPVQVVHRALEIPWRREDWRDVPAADRAAKISTFLVADRRRGFELNRAPLMRVATLRVAENVWQLVLSHHHLLLDGWSFPLLLREFGQIYGALSAGQRPLLPAARPFGSYLEWLRGRDGAADERYWREELRGLVAPTPLTIDRPGRGGDDYGEEELVLSAADTVGLQQAAREHCVTLNTLAQGAYALVLGRYASTDDVVFGVTVSGRPPDLAGVEHIVGLFINTLPLRVSLPDAAETGPWLRGLQERQVRLQEHGHADLGAIQGWSELPRGTALFDSIFVFENFPAEEALGTRFGDIEPRSVVVNERTNYPLTLIGLPGSQLRFRASYDRSRLDAEAVRRLLGHLRVMLVSLATGLPRLGAARLVAGQERADLLAAAKPLAPAEDLRDGSLHAWFRRQAAAQRDAVAVVGVSIALTYGELDDASDRLADRLRAQGVGRGSLVAVLLERDAPLIVALLGILKAGGAYVPLDPVYPDDRLAYVISDSTAAVVVTERALVNRLTDSAVMVVEIDAIDAGPVAAVPRMETTDTSDPADAAYVIYTSGSTGRPKGCVVTHRNVLRLFTATEPWFGFGSHDVWTFFHSAAFDFSVWEIWGALLYGGRLVVVPYFTSREPDAFLDLLVRERVTVLNQTPSAFRQLMRAEEQRADPRSLALRTVVFGGEALELASLRPWFERHGDQVPRLVNMYGITETTVHVTYRPLTQADAVAAKGSLIGVPIPDLQLVVLDSRGELVPLGVPGELYVGGAGLARGYLGRDELTAERFVRDPFGISSDGRLYRTGDLARRLPDGDLDYLGRIDDQVKIRGYRIELGEIETVLASHPDVRAAIVMARSDIPGEKRLVAYVVPRDSGRPETEALRLHLLARIPEYMVPAVFLVVDDLPLTANGKVDRKALPAPTALQATASATFVEPQTERERVLAEIWRDTLGVERVGITDSYFALGGDSITSIAIRSRARERGIEFTLQDLFEKQTIATLLGAPDSVGVEATPEPSATVPFALISSHDRTRLPADVVDAYPLTRLQAGMLFHSHGGEGEACYHDVFSHHLNGPLDIVALQAEVDALVARHPVLRTSFDLASYDEPLQRVHAAADVRVVSGDLAPLSAEAQETWLDALVKSLASEAFVWTQPGLLRIFVHRRGADEFQFTLGVHHAIVDGWTVATLLTELFQGYVRRLGLVRETSAAIPVPAATFRDYVALERAAVADRASHEFWRRTLADAPRLELPAPLAGVSGGVVHLPVVVEPVLEVALMRLAETLRVPLKTVLLAAHVRVLALLGGRDDVVTGLVTNGRPETRGAERLAGLFLNVVPLRIRLPEGDSAALLRAVFAAETALLPFRRLPLAEIQKQAGGAPLLNTDFNFVHFHVYDVLQGVAGLKRLGTRSREETNFALAVNFGVNPQTGRLGGTLSCDSRVLEGAVAAALPDLYRAALAGIVEGPSQPWRSFPLCLGELRTQELAAAVGAAVPWSAETLVPDEVAAQARRTPDALAVTDERGSLTYAELDRQANQVAHALRRRGVAEEDRVAVAMERSTALVVALLGVWRAGAAYVPVDPGYPADRIATMLDDAAPRVVLVESAGTHPGAITWSDVLAAAAPEPTTAPVLGLDGEQLAYVIFTSGSTGRPKGVAVPHAALANHMAWMQGTFPLQADDAVLQKTPISFDAAVWEFWAPLIAGARLVMARVGGHHDPAYLAEVVQAERVTVLQLVPSVLDFFLEETAKHPRCALRRLFSGGEALRPASRDRCAVVLPGVPLINLYGPAECTIDATFAVCAPTGVIPIGRAVANTTAYVLDPQLDPVPMGVPGELYIGGAAVARGYWGLPQLTAERFVPDSYGTIPGGRLYRTGDRVRRGLDGCLYYLGRADGQVKIRGQRVELGEVEAMLAQSPGVTAAAAAMHDDGAGNRRLIGYVVAAAKFDSAACRQWLRDQLPEALVPAVIVPLERLPLSPGGKLDRAALPAPDFSLPEAGAGLRLTAPTTPVQRALADIWQRVLGVRREVGLEDDFFAHGGDSILSLRLVSLAAQAGWKLRAGDVFAQPTLGGLSALARPLDVAAAPLAFDATDVPLTPIQRDFFALGGPTPEHWNQGVVVETRAGLSGAALAAAWQTVVARHPAFQLRFEVQDGQWRQSLSSEKPAVLTVIALASGETATLASIVAREGERLHRGFDLTRGPLVRATWIDGGGKEPGRFIAVAHHLVVDAVSWRIVFEELTLALTGAELPSPTAPFPAWAARAAQQDFSAEEAYWRAEAAAPVVALPTDGDGILSDNREATVASVVTGLSRAETDSLLRAVPTRARSRMDEVLLSALLAAVQDWTGGNELRVSLEGHGRDTLGESVDVSRTVGWFTTLYPLRLDSERTDDAAARLRRVKERVRAVPGRGAGYGWLRQTVPPAQLPAAAEISFNYLGRLDLALEAEGPIRPAAESAGRDRSVDTPRAHSLDVIVAVTTEGLRIEWLHGTQRHRRETIERVAGRMVAELRALLGMLEADGRVACAVPSDFPLAGLSAAELATVLEQTPDAEEIWPLAPLQEGMLVHALHEGVAGVYTQQLAVELNGVVDENALISAWRSVAQRHAALRLEYVWEDLSAPRQVVRPVVEPEWRRLDWSALPAGEQARAWTEWLAADRARGFDPGRGPLWRVAWIDLGGGHSRLVWTHHHLLLDGWSLPIVFRDLVAAWQGRALGSGPSYRDFLATLSGRNSAASAEFWQRYLAGCVALPLPTFGTVADGVRPGSQEHGSFSLKLAPAEHDTLRRFAQQHGVTTSTCVQAAWALVLARHLGTSECIFGVVVSGRPPEVAGVEGIVGLFINTLPLRVRLDGAESVSAWLRRVQEENVALRQHETSRLVDVLGWSGVPRSQPLFESVLIFENYPMDEALSAPSSGLEFGAVESFEQTNFPLTLYAVPGQELTLRFDYAKSRFADTAIAALAGQMRWVLQTLATQATAPVAALTLESALHARQAADTWNRTDRLPWNRQPTHLRVAARAMSTPHAPALIEGGAVAELITLGALDARANQLGRYLVARGAGPGRRVGICLERSAEMVVALLAVLKTGAAYVPLDPGFPVARLAAMCEESELLLAVTDGTLATRPGLFSAAVTCVRVEAEAAAISLESAAPFGWASAADELAYVIFTSGSTGRPKGVQVTHAALANLLSHFAESPGIAATDTLLAVTTLSFDIAALELFLPLVTGARLALATREIAADARLLAETLRSSGATVMQATPATWRLLLANEWTPVRPLSAWCGGEAMPPDLATALLAAGCTLWNLYGPTETTVWSATQRVACEAEAGVLGRPIAHTTLHVLDATWNALPAGVAGELFIGGEGLARGYHGRPDLTSEKFIPDPFGRPGARLYATGDLARRRMDGELEFLGRVDQQVKIRGFRIELGEIETALRSHPAVRAAAVAAREDRPGEKRLVGYVVGNLPLAELREHLRARLPDYMVPVVFVELAALPLTPNGKLDRRALPAPAADAEGRDFVPPRDAIESALAEIWSEVLGVGRVGARDHFFELGGHSLLAAQALARIRKLFQVELPLRTFFEAATPERLGEALRHAEVVPGRALKTAVAWLKIRAMTPEQRAEALERRRSKSP